MKKIRLISKKEIKNAYEEKSIESSIDLKEEIEMETIDEVPKELFSIISETLTFIENVNKKGEE